MPVQEKRNETLHEHHCSTLVYKGNICNDLWNKTLHHDIINTILCHAKGYSQSSPLQKQQ